MAYVFSSSWLSILNAGFENSCLNIFDQIILRWYMRVLTIILILSISYEYFASFSIMAFELTMIFSEIRCGSFLFAYSGCPRHSGK